MPSGLVTLENTEDNFSAFAFPYQLDRPFEDGETYKLTVAIMINSQQACRVELVASGAVGPLISVGGIYPDPITTTIPANVWVPLESATFTSYPYGSVNFYFYCVLGSAMNFHISEVYIGKV